MQNAHGTAAVWRPSTEHEATSTLAAFIEWLRAAGLGPITGPAAVAAWAVAAPEAFADAVARFAGLRPGLGYAGNLARAMRWRGGIIVLGRTGRRHIGAAALRAGAVPARISAMLAAGDWPALVAQAADHLLWLDLRPDQPLLWPGPLNDSWPLGTVLAGATLILCETPPPDPQATAAELGAVLLRRPVAATARSCIPPRSPHAPPPA